MSNSFADYWRDQLNKQLSADRGNVPGDGSSTAAGTSAAGTVITADMMRKMMRIAYQNARDRAAPRIPVHYITPEHAKHEPWKTMLATGRVIISQPLLRSGPIMGRTPTMILTGEVTMDLGTDEEPDKPQPQGKAFTMSQTGAIHPPPAEFTAEEIHQDPVLKFFHYVHLPSALREVSAPFAAQARFIIDNVPRSAERSAGLRKLLEAKDCIVRSMI